MTTRKDDAVTIIGNDLADELEKRSKSSPITKSESFDEQSADNYLIVRSEADEELSDVENKSSANDEDSIEVVIKSRGRKKKKVTVVPPKPAPDEDEMMDEEGMMEEDEEMMKSKSSATKLQENDVDNTRRIDELTEGYTLLTSAVDDLASVVSDLVTQSGAINEAMQAMIERAEYEEENDETENQRKQEDYTPMSYENDDDVLVIDDELDAGEVLQSLAQIVKSSSMTRKQKYDGVSSALESWMPTIKSAIDSITPDSVSDEDLELLHQSQADTQAALAETNKSLAELSEMVKSLAVTIKSQADMNDVVANLANTIRNPAPVQKSMGSIPAPTINGEGPALTAPRIKHSSLRNIVRKSVGINE